jgi:hypothetical protein
VVDGSISCTVEDTALMRSFLSDRMQALRFYLQKLDGLPFALQLVGRPQDDLGVLQLAHTPEM